MNKFNTANIWNKRAPSLGFWRLIIIILICLVVSGGAILSWRIAGQKQFADTQKQAFVDSLNSANEKLSQLQEKMAEMENVINQIQIETQTSEVVSLSPNQVKSAQTSEPVIPVNMDEKAIAKININTAGAGQLDSLPGIGPAYAQRIIEWRSQNNGFKSIEEIKNVKGIGDKTFDKLKDLIKI